MLDSKEIRRRNLRTLIKEQGTATALAEKAQTSAAYISQILSPKTKAFVGDALARRLEGAMHKPHGWMDTLHYEVGVSSKQEPRQTMADYVTGVFSAAGLRLSREVPIVATLADGPDGYLNEAPHAQALEYVSFPAQDGESYALRVRGDMLRPRIKNGEFVILEPTVKAHAGDDVVVKFATGRRMVKELLHIRNREITLGSVNDTSGPITMSLTEIEAIHYIAAIVPRGHL